MIRKSVIYRVDKLLKEGASPKDIIVLTQWSRTKKFIFYIKTTFRETNSLLQT